MILINSVPKRIIAYGVIIFSGIVLMSYIAWQFYYAAQEARSLSSGTIPFKEDFYFKNVKDYNLVIIGDSKAFCAFHPDQLDPVLGTRSLNLAHWSNWFPTQYSFLKKNINRFPKDTQIIWSIGHQNFYKSKINTVYPFSLPTVLKFINDGYNASELLNATLSYTPILALYGRSTQIFNKVSSILSKPIYQIAPFQETPPDQSVKKNDVQDTNVQHQKGDPIADWQNHTLTGYLDYYYDDRGNLASIGQYKKNGAYLRTEYKPDFYRQKQVKQTISQDKEFPQFTPPPQTWSLFLEMLDLFESHDLKVIVNILDEAPYVYASPNHYKSLQSFLAGPVAAEVTKRGFDFVYVDHAKLQDAHYFDYNHMNSHGVERFSQLFINAAKDMIEPY